MRTGVMLNMTMDMHFIFDYFENCGTYFAVEDAIKYFRYDSNLWSFEDELRDCCKVIECIKQRRLTFVRDTMFVDLEWVCTYLDVYDHPWYINIRVPSTVAQGLVNLERSILKAYEAYRERCFTIRRRRHDT